VADLCGNAPQALLHDKEVPAVADLCGNAPQALLQEVPEVDDLCSNAPQAALRDSEAPGVEVLRGNAPQAPIHDKGVPKLAALCEEETGAGGPVTAGQYCIKMVKQYVDLRADLDLLPEPLPVSPHCLALADKDDAVPPYAGPWDAGAIERGTGEHADGAPYEEECSADVVYDALDCEGGWMSMQRLGLLTGLAEEEVLLVVKAWRSIGVMELRRGRARLKAHARGMSTR